ncbi:MAG: GTP-binding protein [Burkholderiaceae bacterium]|nr:GTP-binding protein [Burkholderiaceae bacterium]GIL03764.1 MAG: sulfate adenylyltransferase subunit 1 [Betaproteobacteria bacterium]
MKRDPLPPLDAEDRGVLRFLTCGSVDDGKSTLIGRLLYDTKALLADTLATLEKHAARRGLSALDLSLLTDGLTAEREQGITIDVAYRYFATARRKFIIADAPGHEQYTRNMVTAASTADVAVLLVDARKGVLAQTRRHATIAALLGVQRLILAVNKMDLADWSRERFAAIVADFDAWLAQHPELAVDLRAVPLSALEGDMVVERGANLSWYGGPTLVELLEEAPAAQPGVDAPLRLPVQWVCRPAQADGRAYAGRIEAGQLAIGDEIAVLPSGLRARVARIALGVRALERAVAGQSVTVWLAGEIDISRGDLLVAAGDATAAPRREFDAAICWLTAAPLAPARSYLLRHATREVKARVAAIEGRLDIHTLRWIATDAAVGLNDIARVKLKTQQPLAADRYRTQRATGSFILIDEATHETVAAGIFE